MRQSNHVYDAKSRTDSERRHIVSYVAMILLVTTIFGRHAVVSGLDLNPLKHIKNDNGGAKINRIAMEDAATGTVTALMDPVIEKREEPTSCNEIMAKAVVIASEEKEVAIAARDAALIEAASAKARADELARKIDEAVAEARNATIEFEAIKLLTDRLVQEARREAALKIESIEKETSEQLEKTQQNVLNEKNELLKHCDEMIEKVQADAKDQKEKDQSELIAIKHQWEQQVNQLKDEMQVLENDWQAKITKVIQDSEEQVNVIKKESNEAVQTAYNDAQLTAQKALDRASKIEKDAKVSLDEAGERTEALLRDMRSKSNEMIEKIRKECLSELEEKDHSYQQLLLQNENKLSDLTLMASRKEDELQSVIESQKVLIRSLEIKQEKLTGDISNLKEYVKYWMELHDSQGVVNTTLVVIKSKQALDQMVNATEHWMAHMINFIVQEGKVATHKFHLLFRPYRNEFQRYYHLHLEGKINEIVLPFYQIRILPMYSMIRQYILIPFATKYQTFMIKFEQDAEKVKNFAFRRLCSVTKRCASRLKMFLLSDEIQHRLVASQSILSVLSHIENDASAFVSTTIKVVLLLVLYMHRKVALSLVFGLCFFPLRIVWFLCPLRLITRKSNCERLNDS